MLINHSARPHFILSVSHIAKLVKKCPYMYFEDKEAKLQAGSGTYLCFSKPTLSFPPVGPQSAWKQWLPGPAFSPK